MSGPETDVAPTDSFDGYAVPPGRYIARRVRGPRYFATLGLWVLLLVAGMMILALVDSRVDDAATRYACPPDCGRPPIGMPVATNPRFTAADGSFSVSYPVPGAAYDVTIEPDGAKIGQDSAGFSMADASIRPGHGTTIRATNAPAKATRLSAVRRLRVIACRRAHQALSSLRMGQAMNQAISTRNRKIPSALKKKW